MNKIDWLDLDTRLLRLLVAVVEEGAVTAAAVRLGLTQSAVSHGLDRLRTITGDVLFVKSGRGIVATARAEQLAQRAADLLRDLQGFAHHGGFDPARWHATVTLAANDFQRDLLLPLLARRLREMAPHLTLRVIPSGVPTLDMLRSDHCQLVISPRPPEGSDILQKRLFEDRYRVFFDPASRSAPRTRAEYLDAGHVTVVYEDGRRLEVDLHLESRGHARRYVMLVPGLSALAPFLAGTPLLVTAPGLLRRQTLSGFADIDPPVPCPRAPMYAVWHRRYHTDEAHQWLRAQLDAVVKPALAGAGDEAPSAARFHPAGPVTIKPGRAARATD